LGKKFARDQTAIGHDYIEPGASVAFAEDKTITVRMPVILRVNHEPVIKEDEKHVQAAQRTVKVPLAGFMRHLNAGKAQSPCLITQYGCG
jgi:hypothetical protein